jgi:hypothetical protein
MERVPVEASVTLSASQIADLRLASQSLTGAARRAFQAEMTLKYSDGNARLAEKVFGWGRHTIALGLAEKRTGIICVGSQSGFSGTKRWEERYPAAAETLGILAETHCQPNPSFKSSIAYTRLTAAEARLQLQAQGFAEEMLPAPSTMAVVLNRLGYRLRSMVKARPQKNSLKLT